ncbi:short chain dehydrogenase [Colletotrichum truncatum]|uniref:Short chain dehydrogenase n=1 Tax=Colletotrichum truncatum TaxID=5467 RepID=A0ACC3YUX5_COLTU|nr:short chain dehydrogenase [Colletotrichum truncatum]KAF6785823.1 short chain dehydrogenase [Colletotrichum truncatum]
MPDKWNPLTDIPNLKGKVVVVTGASSGIGLASVKYLALQGATVYFTARSKDKAEQALQTIRLSNPEIDPDQLVWLPLDLSDLKSVRRAVEELKEKQNKVDILSKFDPACLKSSQRLIQCPRKVNNAGVATGSLETAGPGWEWHMAVCHVGHFVFTNGILPLLKNATKEKHADVRIITISSNVNYAMFPSNYEFTFDSPSFLTNPVPYYPLHWRLASRHIFVVDMIRYGASKIANLLFAQELQRLLDEQNLPILSISVHPGGVDSDGCKEIGGSIFSLLRSTTFLTVDQGAVTPLFAATAKEVRENASKFKGKYLEPFGEIRNPHPVAKDQKQIRGMWDNTTSEVNRYLAEIGLSPLEAW